MIETMSRIQANNIYRQNYTLNPHIRNLTDFYVANTIKFLHYEDCHNESVKTFFSNMLKDLDFSEKLLSIVKEYYVYGESFPYLELNTETCSWASLKILHPDYIIVKFDGYNKNFALKPDLKLIELINKDHNDLKDNDKEILNKIGQNLIEELKENNYISLNNFNISYLLRPNFSYELRGTSLFCSFLPLLKVLDFENQECLEKYQKQLENSTILSFSQFFESPIRLELAANEICIAGKRIVKWLEDKVFSPISKLNDFYEYKTNSSQTIKKVVIPSVSFDDIGLRNYFEKFMKV